MIYLTTAAARRVAKIRRAGVILSPRTPPPPPPRALWYKIPYPGGGRPRGYKNSATPVSCENASSGPGPLAPPGGSETTSAPSPGGLETYRPLPSRRVGTPPSPRGWKPTPLNPHPRGLETYLPSSPGGFHPPTPSGNRTPPSCTIKVTSNTVKHQTN